MTPADRASPGSLVSFLRCETCRDGIPDPRGLLGTTTCPDCAGTGHAALYHPYPEGSRVRGIYDEADGESGIVCTATVLRSWWVELPRMAEAMVSLCFDGNGTPDEYDGPARLLVDRRCPL